MTTFEEAQAAFLKADKAATKANTKLAEARKLRDELCPHAELEEKSRYHEGGYLNTAYTEYWYVCKCCGACGEKTKENHGWYA